ncbi:MAG: AAA family ATPase [Myxococcales bacterium]|nr:AAA family ATPase [Myxococcales bacterium]
MFLSEFWARGFRSLADVRLETLQPTNVFYGPNGSGKSNVLAAMQTFLKLVPWAVQRDPAAAGRQAFEREVVRLDDLYARGAGRMTLGARFDNCRGSVFPRLAEPLAFTELRLEVTLDCKVRSAPLLRLSHLSVAGNPGDFTSDLSAWWDHHSQDPKPPLQMVSDDPAHVDRAEVDRLLLALFQNDLPRLLALCDANRVPSARTGRGTDPLVESLFEAEHSADDRIFQRAQKLRTILGEAPLSRPSFRIVQRAEGGRELRERLPDPNPDELSIPLDLAGLGIHQIYAILSTIVISGAPIIGLEEPEAHLHAPTTGRSLRRVLERAVQTGIVQQLFIATHSNLFDLDPTGYFDVSLQSGATFVRRVADLSEIDRHHLYEPGPAKHALARLMRYAPPDEVVFVAPDGAPITAARMLELLAADEDVAVRFLETLHGAALRVVRLDAKRATAT